VVSGSRRPSGSHSEEAGQHDPDRFELAPRAWDHEHCDVCGDAIPAMTLCWVTVRDPYALLCVDCHAEQAQANAKRPWWRFWN
jgi:RNA polymerase-binding transcription factor DksA